MSITSQYYKDADGALIVYDISNRDSFNQVAHWIKELDKYTKEKIPRVIMGNISDLEHKRQVNREEGQELANN